MSVCLCVFVGVCVHGICACMRLPPIDISGCAFWFWVFPNVKLQDSMDKNGKQRGGENKLHDTLPLVRECALRTERARVIGRVQKEVGARAERLLSSGWCDTVASEAQTRP